MKGRILSLGGVVLCAAIVVACADDTADPLSPSGGSTGTNASTDMLKVDAPTPISPINDQQPTLLVLTATPAPGKFVASTGTLQYNFEIYDANNTRVVNTTVVGPSASISQLLDVGKRYTWRVRATLNGAFGPFSTTASFIAPAGGYNVAGELYDPLINGRTLGTVHGSVDFLPGIGLRLNNLTSYVDYQLPATIDSGEISAVITGISNAPGVGLKTRVFSMSQGYDNMTANARRFTIEKRSGAESGAIAWRVITSGSQIETDSPAARLVVSFSSSASYLFRATWGSGRFNLTIDQVGGGRVYEMGKNYAGSYNPTPHVAFIGAPDSTSGADAQTVAGMIIRQFWVSSKPRPVAISQ